MVSEIEEVDEIVSKCVEDIVENGNSKWIKEKWE